MNKENINKLKKYIFFISLFLCLIFWWHLLYMYIYDDAKENPLEWGSISEWIIWELPNLNPLLNNTDYNKNIIYNLYRWLLSYDEKQKKFIPDLSKCNLTDLSNIECILDIKSKWSNWEQIKNEDVINTFKIIQNSDINIPLKSSLKNTEIIEENWKIIFKSKNKNINILPILTQPIVNKKYIDSIWIKELYGKFNVVWWIYSWPYIIDTMGYDDALWIQKLILIKNPNYSWKNIYIKKYIYKFFNDINKYIKNKDSINIFNDTNKNYNEKSSRFQDFEYTLNQFVWLFINEERLESKEIREFLLSKIDIEKINSDLNNKFKLRDNLLWIDKKTIYNKVDINKELNKLWYYKKEILEKKLLEDEQNEESKKINISQNEDLKYISWKINKKFNFVNDSEITLNWKVNDKNPDWVYVNWYKLSSYKKWQKEFVYKLSSQFKNINSWDNKYILEFEIKWKKEIIEEINIFYNKDSKIVTQKQDEFNKKIQEENSKNNKEVTLNQEVLEKIKKLDDKYFYNKDFKKYSLKINYIWEQKVFEYVFNIIKNNFLSYWIDIIWEKLKLSDLSDIIQENKKNYDMILVWIDLWYFDYNLYSYFHSTQTNKWFNFSNTKIKDIDNLLEKLNSKIYEEKDILKDKIKLNWLIEERYVLKVIYQNKKNFYIDKNIKNINILPEISSDIHMQNILRDAFIITSKEINYSLKSINWFYNFLISVLKNDK